ncbi:MAG: SpoIIE family protein phosphatase [Fibrobacter sp.]|nr:SpoIIE family protein phosphatase [Fibrobacter sp.]
MEINKDCNLQQDSSSCEKTTGETAQSSSQRIVAQAELIKKLEQERDWLYLLLDNSHDSIYFKDLQSRFLRVSRGHNAMKFVKSPEEAIGKSDFDYFPVEHAQKAFEDEQRIIATGEPILGLIEQENAPGKPPKWVFTSKMPIFDKNGVITGTFGISRDITQVKLYEDELQKAKNELEDRVRDRTSELQTANLTLERRIDQLNFLTTASYEMAQHIKISDLGVAILRAFTSRLKVSTAAIFQCVDSKFTLVNALGTLENALFLGEIEKAVSLLNLTNIVAPQVFSNWKMRLPGSAPWSEFPDFSSCIIIPLLADNRKVGLVLLFSLSDLDHLFAEERNVILTLAAQAAVCMSNAMYYLELDKKAHLEGELQAARSIQQRFTPHHKPDIPHVNLKGLYSPAYEVGGDYLDYFQNEAGYWVVFIADVCGKGIPAALIMTLLRSVFRIEARFQTSAKQLLCAVNDSMQSNLDDRSFVTAICLVINPDGTEMTYARAGHPKLLRVKHESHCVEILESDGIALGILPDREVFEQMVTELTIPLKKGERYLVYTDGLTEAFNHQKVSYGLRRLQDLLEKMDNRNNPETILDLILEDVKTFTANAPAHDDLTVIAMEVI